MSEGRIVASAGGADVPREYPDTGNQIARCIQVVDLGTHDKEWQGKKSKQRQVMLVWELEQKMTGEHDEQYKDKPFVVNWRGTLSIHEKSKLREFLEGWRGRSFTDDELDEFDLRNVLDKPCLLNLIEKKSDDKKKTYINVKSISPLMKGMEAPPAENKVVYFPVSDIGGGQWEDLYEWVQGIIMDSDEGKAFKAHGAPFTEKTEDSGSTEADSGEEEPPPF